MLVVPTSGSQVEATKYTELGYIGRDVEDIIKDLVENAHVSWFTLHQVIIGNMGDQLSHIDE